MTVKITNLNNAFMANDEIRVQAEEFAALPRSERRAKYSELDKPVKLRARKIIEAQRGISHRTEGGIPVFTVDEYKRQLIQGRKLQLLAEQRAEKLAERMVELKADLVENWGQEALTNVETELANLDNE